MSLVNTNSFKSNMTLSSHFLFGPYLLLAHAIIIVSILLTVVVNCLIYTCPNHRNLHSLNYRVRYLVQRCLTICPTQHSPCCDLLLLFMLFINRSTFISIHQSWPNNHPKKFLLISVEPS